MKIMPLFLLMCLAVITSCSSPSVTTLTPLSEFEADTQDRNILEGNAEIKIPASATNLNGHTDGFREIDTQVRFDLPVEDLTEFLKSTVCTTMTDDDVRSMFQEVLDRPWWKPQEAQKYQWCRGEKDHLVQGIFVDMTVSEKYVIYVIASTK